MAPEIRGFYRPTDEYFNYYDDSAASAIQAMQQLNAYIEAEGPFDAAIAFSQGAALVASYLMQLARQRPTDPLPFRCVFFFSGIHVMDAPASAEGECHKQRPRESTYPISIPSAHIWGKADEQYGDQAAELARICCPGLCQTFVHSGGHEIPGAKDRNDLEACVRVMHNIIEAASVE